MFDVIIGRSDADKAKYGAKGAIFIGKHYVRMGRTVSLSNEIFLDVTRAHVFFIVGKRGSGKSYTMGVIAEGISDLPPEIKSNIAVVLLDTMGIYWTMKYPNHKDKEMLNQWGLKPKSLDVKIYTPAGYYNEFKKKGIPTDFAFSIRPSELSTSDWNETFSISSTEPIGVMIEKVVNELKDSGKDYDIKEIISAIEKEDAEPHLMTAAKNLFYNAQNWGIFTDGKKSLSISDLAKPGQVTILDLSCYATMANSWNIKNLVVGLVAEKLFIDRMIARKEEEYKFVHKSMNIFGDDDVKKFDFPMVWLVLDEAHEFLPHDGKTLATQPLVTILREGRQPGISLILASQQPGKIHTDVMTQADVVIAHRITSKLDTDALGALMQSYMREGLVQMLDSLPRVKGAALIFDDNNERMYQMKLRPRLTWHGGEDPSAIPKTDGKTMDL